MNEHVTTLGALTPKHVSALSAIANGHYHLPVGASQAVAWILLAVIAGVVLAVIRFAVTVSR